MKKWKNIKIEEEIMKDVLRKIKGSKISRSKFVSEAVAKEVKILDDELNSSMIKAMSDQYYDNEESYKKRGIKSFDEFASKMAKSPDKIIELEKKVDEFDTSAKMLHGLIREGIVTVKKSGGYTSLRWVGAKKKPKTR